MAPNPILLIIWAALAVCFIALLMYRGQLTRYEDDQLFLNEEINLSEQEQQKEIVTRVAKLEPLVRIFGGAAGIATVCVVGMYVYDAWQRIQ
jgi:predicted membrane-bound spermidine synthase